MKIIPFTGILPWKSLCLWKELNTVFLGDKHILLQEGDIIFICPGVLHSLAAPESGKRIILQIEWSVVSKIRDLNSILSLISPILTLTPQTAPDIYSDIYHLICQILSEYERIPFFRRPLSMRACLIFFL